MEGFVQDFFEICLDADREEIKKRNKATVKMKSRLVSMKESAKSHSFTDYYKELVEIMVVAATLSGLCKSIKDTRSFVKNIIVDVFCS